MSPDQISNFFNIHIKAHRPKLSQYHQELIGTVSKYCSLPSSTNHCCSILNQYRAFLPLNAQWNQLDLVLLLSSKELILVYFNRNATNLQKYTNQHIAVFWDHWSDVILPLSFISLCMYFLFYEKFMKIGREAIPIPGLEQTINKVARGPKALLG